MERGQDLGTEEAKGFTNEEDTEWGFIDDIGKKELLSMFGKQILVQDRHLTEKIKELKDFVEKYEEIKDTITMQKILVILDYVDKFITTLLSERRYLKELLKQPKIVTEVKEEEIKVPEKKEKLPRVTEKDRKIYSRFMSGETNNDLAREYGVDPHTIANIRKKVEKFMEMKGDEKIAGINDEG